MATSTGHTPSWFQSDTKPSPLSSAACAQAWRLTAKRFYVNGFVAAANAARCFSSARTATADTAIAVCRAGKVRGAGRGAARTGGTSRALRDDSITAIVNARTGSAKHRTP
jgi:hypothetical protein